MRTAVDLIAFALLLLVFVVILPIPDWLGALVAVTISLSLDRVLRERSAGAPR